jgi:hypothetical protein
VCQAIFAGEWATMLYESISAEVVPRHLLILFTVLMLFIGHYVVTNLFTAVLVNEFINAEGQHKSEEISHKLALIDSEAAPETDEKEKPEKPPSLAALKGEKDISTRNRRRGSAMESLINAPTPHGEICGSCCSCCTSCGCCSASSGLRIACREMLISSAFQAVVLALILVSCIIVALDSPRVDPTSHYAHTLHLAEARAHAPFERHPPIRTPPATQPFIRTPPLTPQLNSCAAAQPPPPRVCWTRAWQVATLVFFVLEMVHGTDRSN